MIKTRYGSEIELISGQDEDGYCKVRRLSDGAIREWHVSELRADNQEDLACMLKQEDPST